MRKNDHVAALKAVPLFAGLSDRELKSIGQSLKEELYSPGQAMVTEGTSGGPFFLIIEGRAKVVIGGRTRRTLHPGSYFGEMSLLDKGPRSATIVADTHIKALTIRSWDFLALLEENWSLTRKILSELTQRVRALDKAANQ